MTSASTTPREKTTTIRGLVGRIMVLSLTLVAAIYLVPLLIAYRMWLWLGIVVLTTGAMFLLYSTKRFVPAKYLFPGTFFLTVFLIVPIVLTIQTSFTNFGDGYRGTKEEAIASITNNSMVRTEDSPTYGLSVATDGDVTKGPFSLFLVNPQTKEVLRGSDGKKLEKVDASTVTVDNGVVTKAEGYTILSPRQINTAYEDISAMSVPFTDKTTVKVQGIRTAFEGTKRMVYNKSSDTITNTATGDVYSVKKVGLSEHFVNAEGESLAQSWKQNVGLANYSRLFTEGNLASQFLKAFAWTIIFALGSVLLTLGAACPFFVRKRPAVGRGIGEVLTPLSLDLKGYHLTIVKPPINISTAEAFRGLLPLKPAETPIEELVARPVAEWRDCLFNDFEASLFPHHPVLSEIKDELYALGADFALITGSGAALYALSRQPLQLDSLRRADYFLYEGKL